MIEIRVMDDRTEYNQWLRQVLDFRSWSMRIPLMGNSCTYIFHNPEDAVAFRLKFGI